jgi:hypothetical protein
VGCGSGSDSSSHELKEYSLSDYEGRSVSTDTLAGTWVLIASGSFEQTFPDGTYAGTLIGKEFFVIRPIGDTANYEKSTCYGDGFLDIPIDGSSVDLEFAQGTIQNNIMIQASKLIDVSSEDERFDEKQGELDGKYLYTMVKISDSINSIGSATKNLANADEEALEVFCFNKTEVARLYDGSVIEETSWSAAFDASSSSSFLFKEINNKTLEESKNEILLNAGETFYEKDDDTVSFSLDEENSFNISLSYNASNSINADSVVGSVTINLPEQ